MIHKSVVVVVGVVLLFIFSAIAQADEYSVDQIKRPQHDCCQLGANGGCRRWCGNAEGAEATEIGGEPRYSMDQTGGFHCCIPGALGDCLRWCIIDEKVAALEEGGGTQYSMDQYPGRRCCSWGPSNRCVRWC